MALSWNEIKDRALNFSKEWADPSNDEADAKPFLVEFFNVFGISSKRVGRFARVGNQGTSARTSAQQRKKCTRNKQKTNSLI